MESTDVLDLIKRRYSVRSFRPDAVEEDALRQVLEAARLAPTAANRQPFRFIVIRTAGREEEIRRIYGKEFFWEAPILICACTVPARAWRRSDGKNYSDVDVAIAVDHMTLAAASLGLGTHWVAAFDAGAAREVLGIPKDAEPVVFTPLGYPADQPGEKVRKDLSDLVRYERW
ncbi:nitroreductase [Methanoculleus sp. FWC-SCC1]|uniref:Nitroreductase n=1 Tax=Methanoculleus frigidifontis TaxID=2584085 RepID=A0ABT8M6U1_9EURY|nr:nitroreductase family protein [Methanoculleus sp. FWC-SCC1]MDN7023652.1 nitroreductase [Methanoculleus sp. FWC-SCC1]